MVEFWQEKLLDLQRGPNRRQMRRAKPNEPKRLNVLDINKVSLSARNEPKLIISHAVNHFQ